jgi:transcriptional regulator with XRE-family HTH domain
VSETSEPLLRLLRDLMAKRHLNTAALAEAADMDRTRLRKVLTGAESMTVEELLMVGQVLQLSPADLGLPTAEDFDAPEETPVEEDDARIGLEPWGNHPEQLFRVGFELGCDFLFIAHTDELADSGVPPHILEQFAGRDFPIKLDAAYHRYNNPRFDTRAILLTLSFDALYDCQFPWTSIKQVIFYPVPPESPEEERDEETDEEGRPVLRLVT